MKAILFLWLGLGLVGTLTEVQSRRRRPSSAGKLVPKGWRVGNGPCICKKSYHPSPSPSPDHRQPTGHITRCVCRRPQAEREWKIRFRMNEIWDQSLADSKSTAYKAKTKKMRMKLKKVFKLAKRIDKILFRKGSIIVEFAVVYDVSKNDSSSEDPEKLLRNAMNGELKDLNIYPESLAISDSYPGVNLSEWKVSGHDCIFGCYQRGKELLKQSRTCTEINASCDGIPLTREVGCEEACHLRDARHKGLSKGNKVLVICIVVIVILFVIAVAITLTTAKKSRHKYVSTSPSTTSLPKNDQQLQLKC